MTQSTLRSRIMHAIGAGSVFVAACGGQEGVPAGGTDASTSDASTSDAASDGETDAAREAAANQDASAADTGSDAPVTPADGGHACGQPGAACMQASDCCVPGQCVQSTCIISVRRPFLVGSSLRVAGAVERDDWEIDGAALDPHGVDPATAEALARDWLHDACEEHASVAAFARFTMYLVSVGAPPEMIRECQRAALDEVEHARACFALARRYGGRSMGPGTMSLDGVLAPLTLAEIAALTAEEGCVGETLGVLLAQEQLARATDPLVRALLVKAHVVADEERHAELAWRFVSWAIARGGEPVRHAVAEAIQRAVDATLAMPVRSYDGIDLDAWRAHGRLACEDARRIAERGVREIVEPCARALLGTSSPAMRSIVERA